METTVLGVRLNEMQREKLRALAKENRMSEVEMARLLIVGLIGGQIKVESGRIVRS